MPDSVISASDAARLRALAVDPSDVERAARALERALRKGGKVLLFGNGGSAADAQHVAAELVGRFEQERAPLAAVALTTDSSALTALANDYGFAHVFDRQVEALAGPNDAIVAISTIGLCGAPGSELASLVDVAVDVPAKRPADVQEAHLVVEHVLCRTIEALLAASSAPEGERPRGSRVLGVEELLALREGWRRSGARVVWTNGAFDLLHMGHLRSLEAARALGDILVVGVNDDEAVVRLKGHGRPILPAAERAELIASLRPVDYAIVFSELTPETILEQVRPDVHCKGADYAPPNGKPVPERDVVERHGGRVEFLPLFAERSTTDVVARIRSVS